MHDDIRKFFLTGEIPDNNIVQTRDRLVDFLENHMRDFDYVPALDLEPQFTLDYDSESETYRFQLTVYGVRVEEAVWDTAGIMSGKTILLSTPKNKSKDFSIN